MKRYLVWALGAVLVTAAACGGDDGGSTGASGGSSRDQAFVTGLCKS